MTAETSATWRMALSVSVATGAYGVSFGAVGRRGWARCLAGDGAE